MIALTNNPVFHEKSKHMHTLKVSFHKSVLKEGISSWIMFRVITKVLGRIKFKEIKDLIGMQDLLKKDFKLKGENVGLSLKDKIA